jgi:micrococcal nuclease
MQILLALLGLVLATTATSSSTLTSGTTPQRADPVLVRSVLDGDTIDVVGVGRVRLLGIDAPERGYGLGTAAPFAHEAREKLISLILHRWVRLETDVEKLDGYNRHLAYVVREDGLFVNAELVRDGLARVSARLRLARLRAQARRGRSTAGPARHLGPGAARARSELYSAAPIQPVRA